MKIKESEKLDEYLDIAWEMKKLWDMKVTVIVVKVFEMVLRNLELWLR